MESALKKIPFFVKKGSEEWFNYVINLPKIFSDKVDLVVVFIAKKDYDMARALMKKFGDTSHLRGLTVERALAMNCTDWPEQYRVNNVEEWFTEILFYAQKNDPGRLETVFEWCMCNLSREGVSNFVEEVLYLGMAYDKQCTIQWGLDKIALVKFNQNREINTFYLVTDKYPSLMPYLMEHGLCPANFDLYQFLTSDNFDMAQRVVDFGCYEPDNMEQIVEAHKSYHVNFMLRNNFDERHAFHRALVGKKMDFLTVFFAANARPVKGAPLPNCDAAREWKNRAREARITSDKQRDKFVEVTKDIVTAIENPEHRFSSRRVKNVEQQIASFIVENIRLGKDDEAIHGFLFGRIYAGYFFDWWLPNCSLGQTAMMFCPYAQKTAKIIQYGIKVGSNYFINSKVYTIVSAFGFRERHRHFGI